MKIAFDENVSFAIVRAFQVLTNEGFLRGYNFVTAADYHHKSDPKDDDRHWLARYRDDGGLIVISGNGKMRAKPHERKLLYDAGFIVVFVGKAWQKCKGGPNKLAFLLKWWGAIETFIREADDGPRFVEIPPKWRGNIDDFKDVTGPASNEEK